MVARNEVRPRQPACRTHRNLLRQDLVGQSVEMIGERQYLGALGRERRKPGTLSQCVREIAIFFDSIHASR